MLRFLLSVFSNFFSIMSVMRADDQVIKLLKLNLKRTIDTKLKLFRISISGKVRRVTEMQRENTQCHEYHLNLWHIQLLSMFCLPKWSFKCRLLFVLPFYCINKGMICSYKVQICDFFCRCQDVLVYANSIFTSKFS